MRSASREENSSATAAWTKKRLAAVHASPMLRIFAWNAASTARSMSASSSTRNGALPPSSIDVRRTPSAACASRCLPTAVEPVKDSLRMTPLSRITVTTPADWLVGSTLSTPSGRPASARICASASDDSGVCGAGLRMLTHPAAIAGPILRAPIASGKFHGMISRHGPTGCLTCRLRAAPSGRCE